MNKARRKRIGKAISILEECRDEERECFDNLPESIQCSDRGIAFEDYADQLDEAIDLVQGVIDDSE